MPNKKLKYTDKQVNLLIEAIFESRITTGNLPEDLYFAIADNLKAALYDGFGGSMTDFGIGSTDLELLTELRENIYMFSGAKTYQQVREMGDLIADTNSFSEFKEQALQTYGQYNETWLRAEYNTAKGQARNASQWVRIEKEKDVFPALRYSAVIDDRTSDICLPLDGIILPVDDPLWDKYSPENHFNCRCFLEQMSKYDDYELTDKDKIDVDKLDDTVQDEFKMNPGKDGYIFSDKHPYFEVAPKDKDLAENNFNLPIPKDDD